MTVIYGSSVANGTLASACTMSATTGGTETSTTTTFVSTSLTYGEVRSKGGASTPVTAITAPTGNGWIYFPGVAGTFAAGNWSAAHTHSSVSHGTDTTIRFYKYSAGTYTLIGSIVATQSVTTKTTYTYTATAMGSVTLLATDGIYVDLWWHDNGANVGGDNPTNYVSNSATAGVTNDMMVTTATWTPGGSTFSRTVPASAALLQTSSRTVPATAALLSTTARTVPTTAALSSSGVARTIPATAAIAINKSRTVPATAALDQPSSRTVPATAALASTGLPRTVPATVALQSTNARIVPSTAALLLTSSRVVPSTATLAKTSSRTIPTTAALLFTGSRAVPATAALTITNSRTIPASACLTQSAVFYASRIATTIGGLPLSDQMSEVLGGTETSVSVTMPSSGTNAYVELLAQGGTATGNAALPAPTGRGWSLNLSGSTILSGYWSGAFTLAKSGTSKTGASLSVRWYRRTMDGTYYYIASAILSGQTFSTTKTTFTTPSAFAALWQFVSGDTLYMDAFVLNPVAAWASDVFTVYVSNSATQGVYNDGMTIAPMLIATPQELACYIGVTSLQTGTTLPVLNQSVTIADAIDQRSIATLTVEDVPGTLAYQRGMPTYLGDHDQGKLYDGYVNSDKVSKPAAGTSNAQLEHMLTFMDPHYLVDKRGNQTNYLNWTAGDMVCDFIQSTLSQEGVTGAFALESDYTPTTFGQGTLSGTVATTTTTPFVYAPNTAAPPITSNTGDLELSRAGTQFTLTETVTSDFSSGTLANMVAGSNALSPTTQKALKFQVQLPFPTVAADTGGAGNSATVNYKESIGNSAYAQIWSGSMTVGSSDTLNYDLWIASTSPGFQAAVDLTFSDGTQFSSYAYGILNTQIALTGYVGLWDQNNVSADFLTDLTDYASDAWYSRSITLTGLNGKTITAVSLAIVGSASGTHTIYIKNCYLGSHSGSPFFSTSATSPQVNPPSISGLGGYVLNTAVTSVVDVFRPALSIRISPAHSISSVGLVQNSSISWTAALPTSGTAAVVYPPGSGTLPGTSGGSSQPAMLMYVSYDATTWLLCINQQALPGLPPGANVSGLSLYLMEQFQAGSDPTAIPSLEQVNITINSAAAQTTTDVVAAYGSTTAWNTGTYNGTTTNSNGDLVNGGTYTPAWTSGSLFPHTLYQFGSHASASWTGGVLTITDTGDAGDNNQVVSFDAISPLINGTIECDVSSSSAGSNQWSRTGIAYRGSNWRAGWNNGTNNPSWYNPYSTGYLVSIQADTVNTTMFVSLIAVSPSVAPAVVASYTTTISQGTYYHLKIVFHNNRHTIYFNNGTNPVIDMLDDTYTGAGGIGAYCLGTSGDSTNSQATSRIKNFTLTPLGSGIWTSASIALSSLGTCGYTQVAWSEQGENGHSQSSAIVLASIDGGTSWQQCTNGAEIPQLPVGTSTSGISLLVQAILSSNTFATTPDIIGLYVRVCGSYGTVTGTRISPALPLTSVGYVASSNVMWNANIPTSTNLTVQTTQDLSTYHTVGSSGAGEALPYWTPQPSATQDLFSSNTLANYTNTNKSGGSVASVTYTATPTSLTLVGGSGALYLNNSITTADVDMLCDMDRSDAGGLVWRKVDASNYYELGVYDASSSGGFTNQLRLYKVASGTRSLLGSASSIVFTRGTVHRVKVTMKGGLINVYWDGQCKQSYLDPSPLSSGACGLRNDGGTSRYYQLWIQPLGTNLTGQALYTKVTMTTTDPSMMPQLFTLVACIRGSSIATGATVAQLHPVARPFAVYYSADMDSLIQQSGDYYWYVDKWKVLHFGPRLARMGAFPVQSATDQDPTTPANVYSGYLLYQPFVNVLSSADLFRNRQIITNVSGLVTPPPEVRAADGSTTSWTMGYPLYSAPTITVNGQPATVGVQGIENNKQFYWQPLSASISYDASLPKLPAGTVLVFTYVGQSPTNVNLNNSASQAAQAALELNSGIVDEIESALNTTASGMTTDQATTFGNGLLSRYGNNNTIEMTGVTRYGGLAPGTVIPLFLPGMLSTWNAQLPIVKVTTTVYQGQNGLIWFYSVDATNGPNLSSWQRVFY